MTIETRATGAEKDARISVVDSIDVDMIEIAG
jgi:hypothetical protein